MQKLLSHLCFLISAIKNTYFENQHELNMQIAAFFDFVCVHAGENP
jgi:hypothetical protein